VTDHRGRHREFREDTRYDPDARLLCLDWRSVQARSPKLIDATVLPQRDRAPAGQRRAEIRELYGHLDRSAFDAESRKQVVVCGLR
jgi:hypothetical protein